MNLVAIIVYHSHETSPKRVDIYKKLPPVLAAKKSHTCIFIHNI